MDTSGIGQNRSLDSELVKVLKRLVDNQMICIHIPYIVKCEFETQEHEKYISEYQAALASLSKLKKLGKSQQVNSIVRELHKKLKEIEEKINTDANEQSQEWFRQLNAEICNLDEKQALNAFEAYFLGKPPLSKKKVRDDIPDSFICRGIEKIKENYNELYVVVKDNKIIKKFKDKTGYILKNSIHDLIMSREVQLLITDLDALQHQEKLLKLIKSNNDITEDIKTFLSLNIGDSIHGLAVTDYHKDDSGEFAGVIVMYGAEPEVSVDFERFNYYGAGIFVTKFYVILDVTLEKDGYQNDYYCEYGDEDLYPSNDHNGHFFNAEDDCSVKISGYVTFKADLDSSSQGNPVKEQLHLKNIKIESIKNIVIV